MKNKFIKSASITWSTHDTYEYILKPSRWMLLKWLLRGSAKLKWTIPHNKKRKGLYIKGKKL